MARVWRIILLIPIAFIAACWAAAAVLYFSVPPELHPGEALQDYAVKAALVSFFAAFVVGAVAGIPAFLMILFAESFGWRSLILHLVFGAVVGSAATILGIAGPPASEFSDIAIFSAAGTVGAFVYWLLAGRHAGG
ncbi:putative membrane protein [Rhodopseudomonas julia]|uniref:Membrane protein n=1 Tax=Rhodopseudomonas julia TaxID=200617 RepID=A0ABU0C7F9_9BRAD|nr:hypothetical protein [Rhodopseudomonas julia]MDQ0325565.1 putative membrane protein [Rhodopseudomonas julia]